MLRSGICNHQVCWVFTIAIWCRAKSHQVLRADCLVIPLTMFQIHFVFKSFSPASNLLFRLQCSGEHFKDVTSSKTRSRLSNDSIELVMLQNPKAVVRFTSVTPWQSAINFISFLSDMLNLSYNLASWRCYSFNVFKQSPFPHTCPSIPQLEARQVPSFIHHLMSYRRTSPRVAFNLASLFSEPINDVSWLSRVGSYHRFPLARSQR